MLRIDDFCRSTGLDQIVVEELMRTGRLGGGLWTADEPARPYGIFDDAPSPGVLAAMGVLVSEDYDPDSLRTFELTDDNDSDNS